VKNNRPYNCLLFQTHYGYFICVPYRTNIRHSYAYKFKNSARSQQHASGIDYMKMVIIKNPAFVTANDALVDNDEYIETVQNIDIIKQEALGYLEDYIEYMQGASSLSNEEFRRRYRFSPLQYFHNELGLTSK
ncbi:MAG: hypothetical protein LUI07_04840, partial [Lachnospiraceae bacterium]|nr:hypothetical protein [Lachnospiraceae bacterium]